MPKEKLNIFQTIIGGSIFGLFWLLFATLLVTILVGTFPIITLIKGRRYWQKLALEAANWYWGLMTYSVEVLGKTEFKFSGDDIPVRETTIIIVNHRWYLDWLMLFSFATRKGRLGCVKIFCKDSIKYIPGIGWGCYLLDFIFLKRDWAKDFAHIQATFQNLKESGFPFWLISHIEGTRMSPEKKKVSQEYSKKHDLPVFNHVLLPRMKGITATIAGLRDCKSVNAIYDVTIMYEDGVAKPQLAKIFFAYGMKVHLHVRRYPINSIPVGEKELSDWILQRWKEKDELLEYFYKNGHFPNLREDPFVNLSMNLK